MNNSLVISETSRKSDDFKIDRAVPAEEVFNKTNLFTLSSKKHKHHGHKHFHAKHIKNHLAHSLDIPKHIGIIHTNRPAFLQLEKSNSYGNYTLYISSFDIIKSHAVRKIANISEKINDFSNIKAENLSRSIVWPNGMHEVSHELCGKKGLLVSGGFIPPMYSTGAITFIDHDNPENQFKITKDKKGWFYHKTEIVDMNGDGKPDILTARARTPLIGKPSGELLWLENPGEKGGEWTEHVIASGPDVNFELANINNDGNTQIICTEFFSKCLSIIWNEDGDFKKRVIDDKLGHGFDLQIVDINGDGKNELLVTNHANPGSVYMYKIPNDFKNGEWKRHTLVSGIKSELKGPHQAAPGSAKAFYPTSDHKGKPHILVSGDGSCKAHLLIPKSEDPNDNSYHHHILFHQKKCTIGKIAVADINNDGKPEIFIPAYDKNEIHVFAYPDKH